MVALLLVVALIVVSLAALAVLLAGLLRRVGALGTQVALARHRLETLESTLSRLPGQRGATDRTG